MGSVDSNDIWYYYIEIISRKGRDGILKLLLILWIYAMSMAGFYITDNSK